MNYNKFIELTDQETPPDDLDGVHLAIWYIMKDNWDMTHNITQDINTEMASWIHAYLHRWEGDIGNAHYWYRSVSKDPYTGSLKTELSDIIKLVFCKHKITTKS